MVALQAAGLYLLAAAALSWTLYFELVLDARLLGEEPVPLRAWLQGGPFLWALAAAAGFFLAAAMASLWPARGAAWLALIATGLCLVYLIQYSYGLAALWLSWVFLDLLLKLWAPGVVVFLAAMYALYTLRTAMLPVGVVEWLWRRAGPFTRSLVVLTLLGAGVYAGLLGLTPHPATSTYRVTWAAGAPYKCDGALEFNMVDHPNYWLTVCSVDLASYLSATGEGGIRPGAAPNVLAGLLHLRDRACK